MSEREKDYWFPWYPAKMRRDTMHLTRDQELIYRRLIDFYMETAKGPLPDNNQALANIVRFSLDEFEKEADVIKGFFKKCSKNGDIKASGYLKHTRCESTLADQAERSEKKSQNGKKGGRGKRNEIKAPKASEKLNESTLHYKTRDKDTDVSLSPPPKKAKSPPAALEGVAEAFSMYNETAARIGLPQAQRLNQSREKKLAARLRDAGGLEGWAAAMDKLAASDFCSGRKTDFKASLDFLLQESSFTKLMEGNYDNGYRRNGYGPAAGAGADETGKARGRSTYDAGMEGFSPAADRHARARDGNGNVGGAQPFDAASDLFDERKGAAGKG